MFPFYLKIGQLLPALTVKLGKKEFEEIIAEIPPPPGIGKTAKEVARTHQAQLVKIQLRNTELLCDQLPYAGVKETFRNVNDIVHKDIQRVLGKDTTDPFTDAFRFLEKPPLNSEEKALHQEIRGYVDDIREQTQIFEQELLLLVPEHKREINEILKGNLNAAKPILETLSKGENVKRIDPRVYKEFMSQMVESYAMAYVPPGEPAGVLAAQAMGGPATQIILSGFHKAGQQSGKSESFKRIEQLLNVSKITSNPMTMVYWIEKGTNPESMDTVLHMGTFDFVMNQRKYIEYVTIKDIVLKQRILMKEEIQDLKIPEMIRLHQTIRSERAGQLELKALPVCMELTLDTYKMFTHDILISQVADRLEGYPGMDTIVAIWGSQSVKKSPHNGKIYIFIDEKRNMTLGKSESTEAAYIQFFLIHMKNTFPLNRISGMEGIPYVEPVKQDVLDVVSHTAPKKKTCWIAMNHLLTRLQGISSADVLRLYLYATGAKRVIMEGENVVILDENEEIDPNAFLLNITYDPTKKIRHLTVSLMDKLLRIMTTTGQKGRWLMKFDPVYIQTMKITTEQILKFFQEYYSIEEKDGGFEIKIDEDPKVYFSNLMNYRFIYMAQCHGINMEEIVWLDNIDRFRFHVNDITIMSEYFGIDNVRYYIVEEIHRLLTKHSISINKRHMTVLVDYMTTTGILAGISYNGVRKRKADPLVAASFERATTVFAEGAAMGKRERLDRVSSSLYTGVTAPNIGTGVYNLIAKKGVSEGPQEQEPDDLVLLDPVDERTSQFLEEGDEPLHIEDFPHLDEVPVTQDVVDPGLITSSLLSRTIQDALSGTSLTVQSGPDEKNEESPRYEPSRNVGVSRSPQYDLGSIGPRSPVLRPFVSQPAAVSLSQPAPAVTSRLGVLPSSRTRGL